MQQIKVGADIELFGIPPDGQQDEALWTDWLGAIRALPPKGKRLELGSGFWTHRDGFSAEYGFRPASEEHQFLGYMLEGHALCTAQLGMELFPATDSFDIELVRNWDDAADLLELGCDEDFSVSGDGTAEVRAVPVDVESSNTRECGGHIHIALPPIFTDAPELAAQFVRELDRLVYPMAYPAKMPNTSWYRQRGVFRFKPYGIEYRSIGAAGLMGPASVEIIKAVFMLARAAWEV